MKNCSNYTKIRPIDELRFVEERNGVLKFVSDVTLLLNQERIINDLGEDNLRTFIRTLQFSPKSEYSSGNFTDEQLMSHIKSRYCQSPSEVRDWIESMRDEMDNMIEAEQDAKEQAALKAQQETLNGAANTGNAAPAAE